MQLLFFVIGYGIAPTAGLSGSESLKRQLLTHCGSAMVVSGRRRMAPQIGPAAWNGGSYRISYFSWETLSLCFHFTISRQKNSLRHDARIAASYYVICLKQNASSAEHNFREYAQGLTWRVLCWDNSMGYISVPVTCNHGIKMRAYIISIIASQLIYILLGIDVVSKSLHILLYRLLGVIGFPEAPKVVQALAISGDIHSAKQALPTWAWFAELYIIPVSRPFVSMTVAIATYYCLTARNWREACCANCGYPLKGLATPRCPECGAPI